MDRVAPYVPPGLGFVRRKFSNSELLGRPTELSCVIFPSDPLGITAPFPTLPGL